MRILQRRNSYGPPRRKVSLEHIGMQPLVMAPAIAKLPFHAVYWIVPEWGPTTIRRPSNSSLPEWK